MESKAKYRGICPVFGVSRNHTYTLELSTVKTEHGTPYLWVRIAEIPEYLMPYESMIALISEWDFAVATGDKDTPMLEHLDLVDRWMDIYVPQAERAAV